jgi:hypothetical protein
MLFINHSNLSFVVINYTNLFVLSVCTRYTMDGVDGVSFGSSDDVPSDVVAEQFMLYNRVNKLVLVQAQLITGLLSVLAPFFVYQTQFHLTLMNYFSTAQTLNQPLIPVIASFIAPFTTNESVMFVSSIVVSWVVVNNLLFPIRRYYFYKHAKTPEEFGLIFTE